MFYQIQHFGLSDYFCREHKRDFSFPIHLHESFECIFILSGSMEVTVDGETNTLCAGDAAMIFPNQLHSLNSENSEHVLLIFSPEIVGTYVVKTKDTVPKSAIFRPDPHLSEWVSRIGDDLTSLGKKGLLYTLCDEFDRQATYRKREGGSQNLLIRVFAFVEKNYAGDCTLQRLAEETSFSYSYLSRYFRRSVSVSFNTYVNQYRVGKACNLLSDTDAKILSVSIDCGYTSLRSFNRNFKEITGISPQTYREQNGAGIPSSKA